MTTEKQLTENQQNLTITGAFTVVGCLLFAVNTENPFAGAAYGGTVGALVVAGRYVIPAYAGNRTSVRPKQPPRTSFAYEMTASSQRYLTRPLRDFFGKHKIDRERVPTVYELEQWQYGSWVTPEQPFIITDDDLWSVFRAIGRLPVERNLSYRELVGGKRVRRNLFMAFWNFLRFIEWQKSVHLIEQTRNQWYSLRYSPNTIRKMFQVIEQEQRGRGAGAPSMRRHWLADVQ